MRVEDYRELLTRSTHDGRVIGEVNVIKSAYTSAYTSNKFSCEMTLLHGRLEVHGVDVEKLAQKTVGNWLRNKQAHLEQADRDDLVAYLTSEIWRLSLAFDPALANVSFGTYAFRLANARVVDWYRLRFGRTRWSFGDGSSYTRERPVPLSLNVATPEGGSLADDLAARAGDSEEDRSTVVEGLEDRGDGTRDRDFALLREAATRGARGRAA